MLLLPLLCLVSGCGERGGAQNASRNPQENTAPTKPRGAPPVVTASISAVRTQWKDGQQTFTLSLTNNGEKAETVHAIVYARNEEISPPRRAISPPTAYNWFKLIDSRNGLLTPNDIERNWRADAFFNGRSGRLRKSWDVTVQLGTSAVIEAAHDLDETSPHPDYKGLRLAHAGYTEYQVWLFTPEGQCFKEQTISARAPSSLAPGPTPTTAQKKNGPTPTEPRPPTTAEEKQAASTLRLAQYYLDNKQPEQAREKLQVILHKFPDTEAARTARKLMTQLGSS